MFNLDSVKKIKLAVQSYKNSTRNHSPVNNYRLHDNFRNKTNLGDNNYPILKYINTNLQEFNCNTSTKIHICVYKINEFRETSLLNTNKYLEYLLYKHDKFIFPCFRMSPGENLNIKVNSFLKKLNLKKKLTNCIGFYHMSPGRCYLFFENTGRQNLKEDDYYSWASMDDICNIRKVLKTPISEDVTDLFYKNYNLIHLLDGEGDRIETPKTVYKISKKSIDKNDKSKFAGPYYYFYTSDFLEKYSGEVSKYRIFAGHVKVIHYNYGEKDDYSKLLRDYKQLSTDSKSTDSKSSDSKSSDSKSTDSKSNSHIDDIKKTWPEIYDTLMIGEIKKDSSMLTKHSVVITKSREQNLFISSYTI